MDNPLINNYRLLFLDREKLSFELDKLEDKIDNFIGEWLEYKDYNTGVCVINDDCSRVILTLDSGEELVYDDLCEFRDMFGLVLRDTIKHYWCNDEGVPNNEFSSVDYIFKFSKFNPDKLIDGE